jgi:hypothetical protein
MIDTGVLDISFINLVVVLKEVAGEVVKGCAGDANDAVRGISIPVGGLGALAKGNDIHPKSHPAWRKCWCST